MAAEKPPVRITKQRAQAFLEAADRGIDAQIADLKEDFGIILTRDGNVDVAEDHAALLEPGSADEADIRIDKIMRAIDTLAIFRRRYG